MNPVLAKDAVIFFKKLDQWLPYQCTTDVEINFAMETISVKTITDGNDAKPAGQKKSYSITLGGLMKFDDEAYPHAFDLLDYYMGMVPIEFRMLFTTEDDGILQKIEGFALPTTVAMGGGSQGFAYANVTLVGYGAPQIGDAIIPCGAEITSGQMIVVGANNGFRITALSGGPITRYDWAVNGGARSSAFVDGTLPDEFSLGSFWPTGTALINTLTVWPICENGEDGEAFNIGFTSDPVV